MEIEYIGWFSSILLMVTLAFQLRKQFIKKTSAGVSNFLFVGQFFAESGFITYSILIKNWIFAFTSSVLLIENCIGLYFTLKFKKKPAHL